MARALILGAGAIGRGFLPWALDGFEIDFFDASEALATSISENGGYRSFMSVDGSLTERFVKPRVISSDLDDLDLSSYDIAFVAVGPRNTARLPPGLSRLSCPVFSLENDPASVSVLRARYGLEQVYFGVPDVIASSSASPGNLAVDPQCLHTESGVLYLEESPDVLPALKALLTSAEWASVDQLRLEWDAKLYLHNTPHCVAAYLGYVAGCTYLHEGFTIPFISRTVEGVIEEMLLALKMSTSHEHGFMEEYALKELRRFSDDLLFDPISRVAREPLRKLHPSGRLTGALRMTMLSGVAPLNLMVGIAAALSYLDERDSDYPYLRLLDDFGVPAFMQYHLAIPPDSPESLYIDRNLDAARTHLTRNLAWTS